jgi:hypothetical protein
MGDMGGMFSAFAIIIRARECIRHWGDELSPLTLRRCFCRSLLLLSV